MCRPTCSCVCKGLRVYEPTHSTRVPKNAPKMQKHPQSLKGLSEKLFFHGSVSQRSRECGGQPLQLRCCVNRPQLQDHHWDEMNR